MKIADGTLEALKWLALALMILDHANKWFFRQSLPLVYEAARPVAPVFAFILAYNLTRPGALEQGVFRRVAKRLALYGLAATLPFTVLNASVWPANIMFMLLAGVAIVYGLQRGTGLGLAAAGATFAGAGWVVEYSYPGLLVFVTAWAYCSRPSPATLIAWALAVASLTLVNGNWWAVLAIPLLFAATRVRLSVPRIRHLFYAAYPAHLLVLVALRP